MVPLLWRPSLAAEHLLDVYSALWLLFSSGTSPAAARTSIPGRRGAGERGLPGGRQPHPLGGADFAGRGSAADHSFGPAAAATARQSGPCGQLLPVFSAAGG